MGSYSHVLSHQVMTRCLGPSRVRVGEEMGGYVVKSYPPQSNMVG
jgi:hypothetical protein